MAYDTVDNIYVIETIISTNNPYEFKTIAHNLLKTKKNFISTKFAVDEAHQFIHDVYKLEKIKKNDYLFNIYHISLLKTNHFLNNSDAIIYNTENLSNYLLIQYKNVDTLIDQSIIYNNNRYLVPNYCDLLHINYNNFDVVNVNVLNNDKIILSQLNELILSNNDITLLNDGVDNYIKNKNTFHHYNINKLNKYNQLPNRV
jgi:hypothetical protein